MGKIYNKSIFKPKNAQASLTALDSNQGKTMGPLLGEVIILTRQRVHAKLWNWEDDYEF